MKIQLPPFLALSLAALSGCASTAQRQFAMTATRYGASPEVVRKMERGDRLSLPDLETLARAHVPDDDVLVYLRRANASYKLTTTQIDQLRTRGVSDRIIDYLLTTPTRVARPYRGSIRGGMWYGGFGHGVFGHGSYGHGFGHGGAHHGGHR